MFEGLEWSESYLLGVDPLDGQHQALLGLAAQFDHAARCDIARNDLADLLGRMRDLIVAHFEAEETMMRRAVALIHAMEVEAHLASHREFLLDIEAVGRTIANGGDVLAHWIGIDLAASLVNEIAYHDGQLVTALARAGHLRAS